MGLRSILATVLKGKVLATVLVGAAVVGGGTAAMASTPAKQFLTNQATAIATKTVTPTNHAENVGKGTPTPKATPQMNNDQQHNQNQPCAGFPEIQRLATQFSLDSKSTGDDVKALCSLHDGTFKGTTTSGTTVSTKTVYGYGEINQLLTAAQQMVRHDTNNENAKLTRDKARTSIANVLSHCGTTQLEACLKASPTVTPTVSPTVTPTTTPHPDNQNNPGKDHNSGNNKGKPTATPTAKS